MKSPLKLEDTLNGGYSGLYGEVVTHDTYRLRTIPWQPEIIFDIGANIGIFARFARELFPKALIVSVEPDPENAAIYTKFTRDRHTCLVNRALGSGRQVYHGLTARNGSGETYLSSGLGYPDKAMENLALCNHSIELSNVSSVTLSDLLDTYPLNKGDKSILKCDCEGAENSIWEDEASMKALARMDYICMEVHFYALTGIELPEVVAKTSAALKSLERTHHCELDGVHFWATKKV